MLSRMPETYALKFIDKIKFEACKLNEVLSGVEGRMIHRMFSMTGIEFCVHYARNLLLPF